MDLTWDDNYYNAPLLIRVWSIWYVVDTPYSTPQRHVPPPYGRGQWSNGRIPLRTSLIPAAANRPAGGTAVGVAVDVAAGAVQAAVPGKGRRREGGGPPKSVASHAEEISVAVANAARRGSEDR